MHQCVLILILAILTQGVQAAETQDLSSTHQIKIFTTSDGLPPRPSCVFQSVDGYLWVGTWNGLARFDGHRFVVFNKQNIPGWLRDEVTSIQQDLKGQLWIGCGSGAISLWQGEFQVHNSKSFFTDERINDIWPMPSGDIWFRENEDVLWLRRQNEFRKFDFAERVLTVKELDSSSVLVGTQSGIVEFNHALKEKRNRDPELPIKDWANKDLIIEKDNTVLLASGSGLFVFNGSNWLLSRAGEKHRQVTDIYQPLKEQIWVSDTDGALYKYEGRRLTRAALGAEHQWPGVSHVYADSEGNLWFSAREGLFRLRKRVVRSIVSKTRGEHNIVWAVAEDKLGQLWLGTEHGLAKLENQEIVPVFEPGYRVMTLWPSRSGELTAGFHGAWAMRWASNRLGGQINGPLLFNCRFMNALYEDVAGTMWMGTTEGLYNIDTRELYSRNNGLPSNDVRAILQTKDGSIWIGLNRGGLSRFDGRSFESFSTTDGLADTNVWSLLEDSYGSLWIGTERGLSRYRNRSFETFTTKDGLLDNNVNCILEDHDSNLWLSSNHGIARVRIKDLDAIRSGEISIATAIVFTEEDGLLCSETNGEHQPSGWKGKDGRLWFASQRGVIEVNPRMVQTNHAIPVPIIEEVHADGEQVYGHPSIAEKLSNTNTSKKERSKTEIGQIITFSPGHGRVLQLSFTSCALSNPERVKFRYRLIGQNSSWIELGSQRSVILADLKPGTYKFNVQASIVDEIWSTNTATFEFTIQPFFYQRKWFLFTTVAVIAITIVALIRLRFRVAKRIHDLEKEHALNTERARIARDMHDQIGAGLTQIALFSEMPRNLASPELVGPKVRKLIGSLNELIWAVNPVHDTLENLLDYLCHHVESFLEHSTIKLRLDIPEVIPAVPVAAEVRHNVVLIVTEIVNNIIKHSKASEVQLKAQFCNSILRIEIIDDGVGFQSEDSISEPDAKNHGSTEKQGLHNIKERIRQINGQVDIKSGKGLGVQTLISIAIKQD